MSVLIVGSTALDTIKTVKGERARLLGGSASHAAMAACFLSPVNLVGIVGADFPQGYLQLFRKRNIDLEGLQVVPGKTFHWSGQYEANMNNRRTLKTELGVFDKFKPALPEAYRSSSFVLLANIAPSLQFHVLEQVRNAKFVVADTMDLWLNTALPDLLSLLKRVDGFVLNESEAHHLTKEDNLFLAIRKVHQLGPKYVIVKKGSNGSILSGPSGFFVCPAWPVENLVDPTGAGDAYAGAMMGYLAATKGPVELNIRRAMVYGSVAASFCCEGFGLERTARLTRKQIDRRVRDLGRLTEF